MISGSGRSREGNGNPLQYSCWEPGGLYSQGSQKSWTQLSHVGLFATPWTVESMEFSRPEEPCPSLQDLPNPGVEPRSPELQADSLPYEPPGKPMRKRQH